MKECHRILPIIHDCVEGFASFEEILMVQQHLQECESCNSIISEWQYIAEGIAALLPVPAPQKFEETLRLKLKMAFRMPVVELVFSWFLTVFVIFFFKKAFASFTSLALLWMGNPFGWIKLTLNYAQIIFNFL